MTPEILFDLVPEKLELSYGEIHVFCALLDLSSPRMEQFSETLSTDEHQRVARFHFEKDRRRFVAGRGILREILGWLTGAEPRELLFSRGPRGKPGMAARERGEGTGTVCQRFGVSRKSVERFWKQHRLTGACQPKQIGGYRRSRLEKHDRTLQRWIAGQPDLTLGELQKRCLQQLNVAIGITALWHRLKQLGLSYKKKRRAPPSKIGLMLKPHGSFGASSSPIGMSAGWCLSMKRV